MGHWIYYLPHRFDIFHNAEKSNRPVNWKQNTSYPFLWVITRHFWKITAIHSEQRSQMLDRKEFKKIYDTKSRTSALERLHTHTNSAVLMRTLLLIQFYLHFKHRLLNSTWMSLPSFNPDSGKCILQHYSWSLSTTGQLVLRDGPQLVAKMSKQKINFDVGVASPAHLFMLLF